MTALGPNIEQQEEELAADTSGDHQPAAHASSEPLAERPPLDRALALRLDPEDAMRLRAVPFATSDDGITVRVAMLDAHDADAGAEVSILCHAPAEPVAVTQQVLQALLNEAYGTTAADLAARLGGPTPSEGDDLANLEAVDADELHRMAEQPTLINLVNLIILEAIRSRTSDIHIEPFDHRLVVKYRVDGVLIEQASPPKHLQPAITSRVKIMAGMNIAERYVPQDGHITLRFEGRKVDIRVSTVPTIYGESVVMRILDKEAITLDLKTLGMSQSHRDAMDRLIQLPHGMVLVTGPTGSGKTTTLYAALTKLYSPTKKIITIEDPVEYELSGVNQIPVNPKRGLSFASGLRSILRQDPDVIMVGEIRDTETADISIRSALTGHLLFSTLHTNDAVSAIGRLLDMDVEPFLLASVLEGVIAQRLGRRVCSNCATRVAITEAQAHRLSHQERDMFTGGQCTIGRGCDKCSNTGHRGRQGFYELLVINTALREAISERRSAQGMLALAGADHITMRGDGMRKAAAGLTTIEEVLRTTQDVDTNGHSNAHSGETSGAHADAHSTGEGGH
ncbi:MAG: GspE/PulE family protein [Phycisphaerales bacterium]